LVDNFSDCGITGEGAKYIASFLSQDGVILDELDMSGFSIQLIPFIVFFC